MLYYYLDLWNFISHWVLIVVDTTGSSSCIVEMPLCVFKLSFLKHNTKTGKLELDRNAISLNVSYLRIVFAILVKGSLAINSTNVDNQSSNNQNVLYIPNPRCCNCFFMHIDSVPSLKGSSQSLCV